MMKTILKTLVAEALKKMQIAAEDKIHLECARDRAHGDFACNIALLLAKPMGRKPREIAEEIVSHIGNHPALKQVQSAGAGFINFFVHPQAFAPLMKEIAEEKTHYGFSKESVSRRIHIEFVSSNPTGPLHVGHGRGAAYGSVLSDLLTTVGAEVHREYYVNDAGRQMDILTISFFLRYLSLFHEEFNFPSNAYQGSYVVEMAEQLRDEVGRHYYYPTSLIFDNILVKDEEDKETYIDEVIDVVKKLLGDIAYRELLNRALNIILEDIREDLKEFGVHYQAWFSEQEMIDHGLVENAIAALKEKGHLYEKEGATWFRSTAFGDDKDRVVVRENGSYTYFASDIAYHKWKFEHYDEVINVLGADHHGYIPRLKSIIQAFGFPVEKFHVPIVQFAVLYRGKEKVAMSTRSGSFVTLRELREEVGKDAARFFYIMRKADQHMDFDLSLAKSKSNENPVYYVQYAHARIASVFRQLPEKQLQWDAEIGLASLDRLESDIEKDMLLALSRYRETINLAAAQFEPHLIVNYLRELCEYFHSYYNTFQFLVTDDTLRHARLCLIAAIKQIIANGLTLLGVSAPEIM
jgi:arginyl-tRNA synthetase